MLNMRPHPPRRKFCERSVYEGRPTRKNIRPVDLRNPQLMGQQSLKDNPRIDGGHNTHSMWNYNGDHPIVTHPICANMRPITHSNQDYHTRLEAKRRAQEYKIFHELKNAPWDNTWGKPIRLQVPSADNALHMVGHTMGAPLGAIYRNDKHPFFKDNNKTFGYNERRGMHSPLKEFIQNDPLMRKLTLEPRICPERKAYVEERKIQHIKTLQHLIADKNMDANVGHVTVA